MGGKHSERKEIETPGDVYGSGAHGQKTIMARHSIVSCVA